MCNFIKADGKKCGNAKTSEYCHIQSHKDAINNQKKIKVSEQEYKQTEPTQDTSSDMTPQPNTLTIMKQTADTNEYTNEMSTMTKELDVKIMSSTNEVVYIMDDNSNKNNQINCFKCKLSMTKKCISCANKEKVEQVPLFRCTTCKITETENSYSTCKPCKDKRTAEALVKIEANRARVAALKTVVKPVVEPVVESVVEPVVESVVEPVVESVVELVVESVVEPVEVVEQVVEPKVIKDAKWVIENKKYDPFLFDLCTIINDNWFKDRDNLWKLAGLLSKIPGEDKTKMKRTYCAILYTKLKRFDSNSAQLEFDDWINGKSSKYPSKLTISELKKIAGGCNSKAYNEWKDTYEPEVVQESKSKKNDNKIDIYSFLNEEAVIDICDITGISIDHVMAAMNDKDLRPIKWVEKYITPVQNNRHMDIDINDRSFVKFNQYLSELKFYNSVVANKFVSIFINRYYILFYGLSWIRETPTSNSMSPNTRDPLLLQSVPKCQ